MYLNKLPSRESRGDLILETIHGSRLYGMYQEDSDYDYYRVFQRGKSRMYTYEMEDGNIVEVIDIGLPAFLKEVHKGTHQAVEALHSKRGRISEPYKEFIKGYRSYSTEFDNRYRRTIKSLCLEPKNTLKHRRQAVRLLLNLLECRKLGKFNPTLSELDKLIVVEMADRFERDNLYKVLSSNF